MFVNRTSFTTWYYRANRAQRNWCHTWWTPGQDRTSPARTAAAPPLRDASGHVV